MSASIQFCGYPGFAWKKWTMICRLQKVPRLSSGYLEFIRCYSQKPVDTRKVSLNNLSAKFNQMVRFYLIFPYDEAVLHVLTTRMIKALTLNFQFKLLHRGNNHLETQMMITLMTNVAVKMAALMKIMKILLVLNVEEVVIYKICKMDRNGHFLVRSMSILRRKKNVLIIWAWE